MTQCDTSCRFVNDVTDCKRKSRVGAYNDGANLLNSKYLSATVKYSVWIISGAPGFKLMRYLFYLFIYLAGWH